MESTSGRSPRASFFRYVSSEVTRGYVLEDDEKRYTTLRQKMYTFMKIPRELEKFMSYGFFHCLDSFLFIFTFLPIRVSLAAFALLTRPVLITTGLKNQQFRGRWLNPAEIIDLLKGLLIGFSVYIMSYIDTSMMYHIIKSQSVIKLYLFYNMLEVADRLFSAFGQDTIDALFWTATEPRNRKRHHIGVIPHFLLALVYVTLHTLLVLLQATTLNVAVNASNKALLSIMMSNNFVELKGSVFKKFDKKNLFQVSCSDVRERFHLFSLIFIVVVQTMKEYSWKEESFWSLAPDCLLVLSAEFLVDWVKHAFITRFNEVSAEVYKDYTIHLAYDLAQTKQNNALADQCDIVSRRMGFIPLPLGVVMTRVIGTAFRGNSRGALLICFLAYLCLLSLRILGSIVILGKACDLIDQHRRQRTQSQPKGFPSRPPRTGDVQGMDSHDEDGGDGVAKKMTETSNELKASSITLDAKIQSLFGGSKVQTVTADEVTTKLEDNAKFQSTPSKKTSIRSEGNGDDRVVDGRHEGALMATTSQTILSPKSAASESGGKPEDEDDNDDVEEEEEVKMMKRERQNHSREQQLHRWSNRRHQLLHARQLVTDSRRRPLSCTPPSTSTSVDDEDSVASSQQFGGHSSMDDSSEKTNASSEKLAGAVVVVESRNGVGHELPDPMTSIHLENKPWPDGDESTPDRQSAEQEEEGNPMNRTLSPSSSQDSNLRCKSLSSPDFLKIYRCPNDWPQLEEEEDDDSSPEATAIRR